jgi:hypothetical protein
MQNFKCVAGSSFSDVCLNTYGSLDYYIKMCGDNGVEPNDIPYSGQIIAWDDTLVVNQTIQRTTTNSNIIYATLYGSNTQNNIPMAQKYADPNEATYTASADGETVFTIIAVQGADKVFDVAIGIQQLLPGQYSVNLSTGVFQLLGGLSLSTGETLFAMYTKIVNY